MTHIAHTHWPKRPNQTQIGLSLSLLFLLMAFLYLYLLSMAGGLWREGGEILFFFFFFFFVSSSIWLKKCQLSIRFSRLRDKLSGWFVVLNRWTIKWNCFSTPGRICWFWIICINGCTITCPTNRRCPTARNSICCRCRCSAARLWPSPFTTSRPVSPSCASTCPTMSVSNFSCFSIQVCLFFV